MKKRNVLAIILSAVMVMGLFTSCGGSDEKASENKTEAQFECGKKTYDSLNNAADICIEMMTSVYNAWRFSIYDAEDYSSYEVLSEFADEVNLTETELGEAWASYMGDMSSYIDFEDYIDDFNYTIWVVIEAYNLNGKIGEMDDELAKAKAELKTMTAEYSDYSEYPTLKSYYSEVNSYAEFAKSPECSFEQLKTTIEDYENEIRTYRSDLEFIFED